MRTELYDRHLALGAKIVEFAGWEMPVQYRGVIEEHLTVREKVGIFDVSHMGRVQIQGPDAETFLDYLSTNRIEGKPDFSATYTLWCDAAGGCVDDLIIYKENAASFFVIVNAGNREKDLQHMITAAAAFDVVINDLYQDGILAIQGPKAHSLISKIFPLAESLRPMRFAPVTYQGLPMVLSATGYTGSGGYECYGPMAAIIPLWDQLLERGASDGIQPIGLGARDTLRLEAGYPLYGHELSTHIAPIETVAAWAVKSDKEDFVGKQALQQLELSGGKRSQAGVVLKEKGIAREGYHVFQEGKQRGIVTSGTQSPSLKQAIAIILVDGKLSEGETVDIDIRGRRVQAEVVPLPFWRNRP